MLTRLRALPFPPVALVQVAALYSELGDHPAALELLEAAAKAAPGQREIQKALASARRLATE